MVAIPPLKAIKRTVPSLSSSYTQAVAFTVPVVLWIGSDIFPGLKISSSVLSPRHLGSGEGCVARGGW